MKYKCKNCGIIAEAENLDKILKLEKLCLECIKIKQKKQRNDRKHDTNCINCGKKIKSSYVCLYTKEFKKKYCSDSCAKEYRKKHKVKEIKEAYCKHCNKLFTKTGTAMYCSDNCRKKGKQNTKFYEDLKIANITTQVSKIDVFGFHKERSKYYASEKSRRK